MLLMDAEDLAQSQESKPELLRSGADDYKSAFRLPMPQRALLLVKVCCQETHLLLILNSWHCRDQLSSCPRRFVDLSGASSVFRLPSGRGGCCFCNDDSAGVACAENGRAQPGKCSKTLFALVECLVDGTVMT